MHADGRRDPPRDRGMEMGVFLSFLLDGFRLCNHLYHLQQRPLLQCFIINSSYERADTICLIRGGAVLDDDHGLVVDLRDVAAGEVVQ